MPMMGMGGCGGGAKPGDWQCPNVNCQNHTKMVFGSKPNCPQCGSANPMQGGGMMGGGCMMGGMGNMGNMGGMGMGGGCMMGGCGNGAKPGDWQCPNTDCQNHTKFVFASKSVCPKCGSSKPAEGGCGEG